MDEPTCRFIDDQERGVFKDNGGFHDQNFEERSETSKMGRIKIRIKMSMYFGETAVPVL